MIVDELGFSWVEAKCTGWVGEEKMAKELHEKEAEVWCGMEAGQFVAEVVQLFCEPRGACRTSEEVLEVFSGVLTRRAGGGMCGCPAFEASAERKVAMYKFAEKGPMGNRELIDSLLVCSPMNGLRNRFSLVVAFVEVGEELLGREMV